jgi:putative PIN family toxin of toxin-antitoxin system
MSEQRVVFDMSTLVSAALRQDSIPYQALMRAFCSFQICISEETLGELKEVLTRDKFIRYLNREDSLLFIGLIEDKARLFRMDEQNWPGTALHCRDPKDDKFLILAEECEAGTLVSSDEDLLVLHLWNGVRIVRPAEFLLESA